MTHVAFVGKTHPVLDANNITVEVLSAKIYGPVSIKGNWSSATSSNGGWTQTGTSSSNSSSPFAQLPATAMLNKNGVDLFDKKGNEDKQLQLLPLDNLSGVYFEVTYKYKFKHTYPGDFKNENVLEEEHTVS